MSTEHRLAPLTRMAADLEDTIVRLQAQGADDTVRRLRLIQDQILSASERLEDLSPTRAT